ncbi:hypothetical protein BGZ96_012487 [Linnemannia gamsii]|uniref:Uncharacterized protein n=1 Tax=Linnemannia gamsii TaxID=64522 RepID=A0ABQ7JR79_9FUNG|nr:hypothetical protein BGZ96_012487 [Linnemannia gamsii]
MLSSHHGKSVPSPSTLTTSTDNSRPCFNDTATHNHRTSNNDSFGAKSLKDESIELTDSMDIHQIMLQKSSMKKNNIACQQSPKKQFANTVGNKTVASQQIDNSLTGLENATSSSTKRLQRTDLSITTDVFHQQQHGGSTLARTAPMHQHQQQNPYSARPAVPNSDLLWNTPPANCKLPNPNLSRRASLAAVMMSPPSSAGLANSATNHHGHFSSRDFVMGESVRESDIPKQKAVQKRINNLNGPSRRHSVPNLSQAAAHQANNSNVNGAKNALLQRMTMGAFGMPGTATDGSYLPTPTDSTFNGSLSGDSNQPGQQPQPVQKKASQTGSQSRRGSKAKVKRRVGSIPAPTPPMLQSYMPTDMNWSLPPSDQQLVYQQHQFNNSNVSAAISVTAPPPPPPTSSTTSRATFYHGPAPCGNPEPLYEYLASPTVVPGLEIIGHDFYGNYVQILPICPDTTCSMNQDPVYLNLLQAIYAHTIPFLDLAPGSEEESQLLNNGTPSAITTQSIQPPFKNLLPLNGPAGQNSGAYSSQMSLSGSHTTLNQHSTLTSSVSSPSFQQMSVNGSNSSTVGSNKLLRRASMASISSTNGNTASNSRRSSVVSNPNLSNPARKKKNASRTHPYKSTSSFKEDNPMVTEAILTQVGGLGGIGNCATVSATDPRHKVAEKMVHMDEAEYAAHYSKHQQVMNKSASTTALCLAQTLVTSMNGSSLGPLNPSSLMSSSVTAPSITNATTSSSIGNGSVTNSASSSSPLESIAAADFIRALSECSGGMNDLGLQNGGGECMASAAVADITLSEHDLLSLENLMMMDSNAAAAIQAAAATAWPNWFDLSQLEKDICEAGLGHQASAFSSASCSMANLPLSTSSTLTSFANHHHHGNSNGAAGARDVSMTNLLLSSSTNLAMMDDLFEDHISQQQQQFQGGTKCLPAVNNSDQEDTEMAIAATMSPITKVSHINSTSQVLVFDQLSASHLQRGSSSHRSSSPSGDSTTSRASTDATATNANEGGYQDSSEPKEPIANDLTLPYTSSLLTVLPFSAHHSHPIFPTRGNRRSGWYRSKSVASQGLSQITGVDYTTTCWYDVERLQNVVRDSISFQESSGLKSLEDLTEPGTSSASTKN